MMRRFFQMLCALPLLAMCSTASESEEPSRYYFDHGAEQFTRDEIERARAWVNEGLQLYPSDKRLILLKQLLEQPPSPQQQPNPNPETQPQSDSSPDQDSAAEQQGEDRQPANPERGEEMAEGEEELSATAMSEEEAEQILDALKDREAAERARMAADRLRREMSRLPPVEKDW